MEGDRAVFLSFAIFLPGPQVALCSKLGFELVTSANLSAYSPLLDILTSPSIEIPPCSRAP